MMRCGCYAHSTTQIQRGFSRYRWSRKLSVMVQQSCNLHSLSDGDGSRAVDIYVSCWFRIKGGIAC